MNGGNGRTADQRHSTGNVSYPRYSGRSAEYCEEYANVDTWPVACIQRRYPIAVPGIKVADKRQLRGQLRNRQDPARSGRSPADEEGHSDDSSTPIAATRSRLLGENFSASADVQLPYLMGQQIDG